MARNHAFEFGAECLGAYGMVAAWRRPIADTSGRFLPSVIVSQASTAEDGVYVPAAEVTVTGTEALLALRKAVDEALTQVFPEGTVKPA